MMPYETTVTSAWSALGWSVVHFLWQGAIIGLLAAALLNGLRHRTASVRYIVACGAMLACLLTFIATFLLIMPLGVSPSSAGAALALPGYAPISITSMASPTVTGNLVAEVVAWCWAFGVFLMAARFARHGSWARRLKTYAITEPDPYWQRIFQSLKQELGVTRAVRLLRSGLAETAMVVGWITPVILVPASAFASLTPDQLRSILAHELSHIRRYDHLVNMAQGVIETILFFHPTVWWISRQTHREREHCCDDASVRATENPRTLAEALTRMESLRLANPTTALAANGGPLMKRISRILGAQTARWPSAGWRTPTALALGTIIIAAVIGQAATTLKAHTDYEAVGKRLRAAVAAGELTPQQAKAMMSALRRTATQDERRTKRVTDEDLARAGIKIRKAVAEGKISAEDGRAKMEGLRKMLADQGDGAAKKRATKKITHEDLARAGIKIRKAVAEGKISAEDGRAKMEGLRKMLADQGERSREARKEERGEVDWEAIKRRIEGAVKAGKMTREEADAKYREIKKQMAARKDKREKPDWEDIKRRIEGAVKAGKLTRKEADAKYQEFKKQMATRKDKREKPDWEAIKRRIEGAVKAGKMTREEADAKYREIKERMRR